ncbi:MAG: VOC family protein [Polyangiales bacterium]
MAIRDKYEGSTLDHIGVAVSDAQRSRDFYVKALAPLGIELKLSIPPERSPAGGGLHGFGATHKPYFWIHDNEQVAEGTHIAFTAPDRATVDAFYEAALAAGGRDNGPPGIRSMYHQDYYGAFVLDPDGINVEAVCHRPE